MAEPVKPVRILGEDLVLYRTLDGQTYGWDAVLTDGAAWFLENEIGLEAMRRRDFAGAVRRFWAGLSGAG